MIYKDSNNHIPTATKILKVNHAGEFGAVCIYRAQIWVCTIFNRKMLPVLNDFIVDERRHLQVFDEEISRRNGVRCKSYYFCGLGGYFLGFVSSLLGTQGIKSCTFAVEHTVVSHLKEQLKYLKQVDDVHAFEAVSSILADEESHRDYGSEGLESTRLVKFLSYVVKGVTTGVIKFGMR
ncbi:demethoxyubiquinone hydroxylase family protein [Marinicella rhabdoformis]|uniref:demethoxyubiquinone hydroxylase family protein n=1 Tax=Marinicella rhabdoformis TaxID=2580566 RepID=UPI0012AEDC98